MAEPNEHTARGSEMKVGPVDVMKRSVKFYAAGSVFRAASGKKVL
jgi:hypothetical protein